MHVQELTLRERSRIEHEFTEKLNDADEVLQHTSQLLALISNQAGLAESPGNDHAYVNRLEIMSIGPQRVALLIVDNYGRVRTQTLNLGETVETDQLQSLNQFLNVHLRGVRLDGLTDSIEDELKNFMDEQRRVAELALRILGLAPRHSSTQLFLEGAGHLFAQPEFQDVDRARKVFDLFDERTALTTMLRESLADKARMRGSIHIGRITADSGLEDISVVTSPYYCKDEPVGMIGVLGPRRMPYSRLTSIVNYTADMVSRMLTRLAQ